MRKRFSGLFLAILLLSLTLTGCNQDQAANAKAALSKNQAMAVIVADFHYHGLNVKDLSINKIATKNNGTAAVVDYTVTLSDGSKKRGQSNFIQDHGKWEIEGHHHE